MKKHFEHLSSIGRIENDVPPQEILEGNDSVAEVKINEFDNAVERLQPGRFKNFLKRWGMFGLTFMTLASNPGYSDASAEEEFKKHGFGQREKTEQVDSEQESAIPEIVVYGDRDDRTDAIVNYLSGKDGLPESMQEEMTARFFVADAINVQPVLKEDGSPDENHPCTRFAKNVSSKIKLLNEDTFKEYVDNKGYVSDMIDYQIAILPTYYHENNPLKGDSYDDKINYLKNYQASLMSSKKEGDAIRHMPSSEFESLIVNLATNQNGLNKLFFRDGEFSAKKYNTVWTIQRSYGQPSVDLSYQFSDRMVGGTRAYFNMDKNKMFLGINDEKGITGYIDEMSHSKQLADSKVTVEEMIKADELKIVAYMMEKKIDKNILYSDAYESFYDEEVYGIPGTIEYEAHKQIQPELEEELQKGLDN